MFLSEDEIQYLTGKKRRSSQRPILNSMGITHKVRPDGSLVVLRSHVEAVLGGQALTQQKREEPEPNWDALKQPIRQQKAT